MQVKNDLRCLRQISGSQDFNRSPEINSSCGHYKDPWAFQEFDDVI